MQLPHHMNKHSFVYSAQLFPNQTPAFYFCKHFLLQICWTENLSARQKAKWNKMFFSTHNLFYYLFRWTTRPNRLHQEYFVQLLLLTISAWISSKIQPESFTMLFRYCILLRIGTRSLSLSSILNLVRPAPSKIPYKLHDQHIWKWSFKYGTLLPTTKI